MGFKFEKLNVWQLAVDFANDVHLLTRKFPKEEMFGLTSQMKRAADSISLNISEGAIGQSPAEYRRFLSYASRSCAEVIACLHHADKRKYINQEDFDKHYSTTETIFKMVNKLRNSIGD